METNHCKTYSITKTGLHKQQVPIQFCHLKRNVSIHSCANSYSLVREKLILRHTVASYTF